MKLIKTLSSISKNISKILSVQEESQQYLIIYKTEEQKTKSYIIDKPNLFESFGNKAENRV